jgi:hypothetical protein
MGDAKRILNRDSQHGRDDIPTPDRALVILASLLIAPQHDMVNIFDTKYYVSGSLR